MSFKALVTRYKISTIIISIILGLSLIAGGITAGILLTKQSNPPADALTGTVYINADGTTATSSDYDWALEIYYSSSTATVCRIDGVTRSSSSTATTIVIPDTVTIGGSSKTITTTYSPTTNTNGVFYKVSSYITSVILPNTLTNIGSYLFYNCNHPYVLSHLLNY